MKDGRCWVLTAGEAGMRSQALGLAESVGLPIEEKHLPLRAPWKWLPGGLLAMPLAALESGGDPIRAPWPLLIVACGRRAIDPALAIKRVSGGKILAVYVQNPEFGREKFDLVAAMPHDGVTGRNVIVSETALHGVTPARLSGAREGWRSRLSADGRPLLGVLVGGDNGGYRLTPAVTGQLIRVLGRAHDEHGLTMAVATSRRTGETASRAIGEAIRLKGGAGSLWSESDAYLGILANAERILVTGDSISMISEALATGRPVHVLPLEGYGRRHDAFLKRIAAKRFVSVVEGNDLDWSFQGGAVNATPAVAARIREMLAARQA